jgi:hypothetical protein
MALRQLPGELQHGDVDPIALDKSVRGDANVQRFHMKLSQTVIASTF